MNRSWRIRILVLIGLLTPVACRRGAAPSAALPIPKAFGTALVEVSGGKQTGFIGTPLDQPLVVQVNDAQGNAVPGALVSFVAGGDARVTPSSGLTGDDGQLSVTCQVGSVDGHYRFLASTHDKSGKAITLQSEEIALGYQQNLGRQLNRRYCSRCHDQESTVERVSNYDNLVTKPHSFTNGGVLNAVSDTDLAAIITYGGAARHQSAEMPAYGGTLSKTEVDALIAYLRAVADPPYSPKGLNYAYVKQ